MNPLRIKPAGQAVGMCAALLLASVTGAAAQGFYVGQQNGNIDLVTSGGTVPYGMTTATNQVGGMIFDANNNLYVADTTGGNVYRYDTAGNRTVFASGLTSPGDIAIDNVGNVYVANTAAGTILQYSPAGGVATTYATGLLMPQAITFGPTGLMYVAEQGTGGTNSGRISVIPVGGGTGTALATSLNAPVTLTLNTTADALYVGSQVGNSVAGFSTLDGSVINTYSGLSFTGGTSDLTMDAAGNLYVLQDGYTTNTAGSITVVAPNLTVSTFGTVAAEATGFVYSAAVPEPTSLQYGALAAAGLAVIGWRRARRTV